MQHTHKTIQANRMYICSIEKKQWSFFKSAQVFKKIYLLTKRPYLQLYAQSHGSSSKTLLTYRPDRSLWELIFRIANIKKHTWFPKPRISYRRERGVCNRDTMRSCIFARRIWIETVNVGLPLLLKIKQTNGTNGINEIVNAHSTTHTQPQRTATALHSMHTEIVYNKNKLHKIKFKRTVHHPNRTNEHGTAVAVASTATSCIKCTEEKERKAKREYTRKHVLQSVESMLFTAITFAVVYEFRMLELQLGRTKRTGFGGERWTTAKYTKMCFLPLWFEI